MGMHLRDGRDFDWALDRPDTQSAVIINEAAARVQWPGQNPIGKLVDCCNKNPGVIVGVISDVRQNSLEDAATPGKVQCYFQTGPGGPQPIVPSQLPP